MARSRRTTENTQPVTHEKLVRLVKSGITSHSEAATELGVTVGQISSLAWSRALVEGGEYSEQPATSAAVKRMRDVEGLRWELIAARTGASVSEVKELHGDADNSVVSGRRSKANGNGGQEETTTKRGRGRPAGSGKTTTGKRATAAATPRRSRTRAQRQAGRSSNPS
jgi:hypothetical protein